MKLNGNTFYIIVTLVVAGLLIYTLFPAQETDTLTIHTDSGPINVVIEIADNPVERSQGLMFRESLGANEGMLFIFDEEAKASFWMKNTWIPLDMLFIDSDFEIKQITTAIPCEADPCPIYESSDVVKYVLEVNAGFAKERGIKPGNRISI